MLLTHLIFFRFFTGATDANTPPVVVAPPAGAQGNWKWDKAKAPRKRKVLRFSDFENRDELERLLKDAVKVIPMSAIDDSDIILADDEDEDDMLILAAAMKILQ